ncbi:hypothetical protein UVI_02025200 [Ustilaginoidea virens]|uniref:Sphingoid long-chain base transporter RSB1 n=1 Tax=Ustilaginoidea virens TaxID=1159556 RepID=A0A1B5KR27_USTVR|nr:hypothetical protein UVI_02025200 [Ustilaginoidea virens]
MPNPAPPDVVIFGPKTKCTLDNCPVEWSIYGFQPSLAANIALLAIFAVIGIVHAYLGFRWRSWGFMVGMLLGCLSEAIGYIGRIMLHSNPFSFIGFMIQIVCLTIAPVFFSASIYVTLSKAIAYFTPDLSRFRPQLFYWIFVPLDVVCLVLQAAGGALSTNSTGSDENGVNISMAGLVLQVIVITVFIAFFADYMIRYQRSGRARTFDWRLKIFFLGLSVSIVLILARCAYRVAELKDGYGGSLIREQVPFIVFEGIFIVVAAVALFFGHPGLVFQDSLSQSRSVKGDESGFALPQK